MAPNLWGEGKGGAEKPPELGGSRRGKLKASVNLFLTKCDIDHPFCKKHFIGLSPRETSQAGRVQIPGRPFGTRGTVNELLHPASLASSVKWVRVLGEL